MALLSRYLPFSEATTTLQAVTYLLGISLFSISFLVFLNSSISFVITDLIGVKDGVGDIVGTLGFVDELVALIACPVWGLVSDRLGVRWVAVIGYAVIGASLILFVQAKNVYPQLLLARIFFAIGATAAATMVTAILPSLTDDDDNSDTSADAVNKPTYNPRLSVAMSLESDMTITPARFRGIDGNVQAATASEREEAKAGKPSALSGYVGLFTGCGALVALSLFLPLPARFGEIDGVTSADAVADSFYVVGIVAFIVSVVVFFGLRDLKGEEGKGWNILLGLKANSGLEDDVDEHDSDHQTRPKVLPYLRLLRDSVTLGFTDSQIALGYLGGFVARASTVAISLFIPLYINTYYISNGFCHGSPHDPSPELKKECRAAYLLSSILTGVAQLFGLFAAPLFGYFNRRRSRVNYPILVATASGIVGYIAFPQLQSPEYKNVDGRGGSLAIFFIVILIGISQIGSIVCSLGFLGRGVLTADIPKSQIIDTFEDSTEAMEAPTESAPLLQHNASADAVSRVRLKGSIAGMYSWFGGAAILLLTKLGGFMFDAVSHGAPFYMMASFNAILFLASLGIDAGRFYRDRQ
ncbi:major facilitator superfamily transporter [Colletotrichum graminicola]|uniref:Major facilitator superfamily transporter n=1 Tax=Colletotrichum graminicola (strain M1.001 / M2 / FGSC 10212) TaxID=645133 RepID=E3QCG6_COLGM|nr:major facilitator superfamily transporter [Colletotrichum graminicola M1.001]EFQ28554.1 major facilitator superfamily transporter [Colletotrichum graminicola M1.001]WDK15956.1 major facilitator superfamily transporter [Colletotrichum graminicola]